MKDLFSKKFDNLLNIGMLLLHSEDLETFLEKVLSEARSFTNADGGTIYLVDGNKILFKLNQCQTFIDRFGKEYAKKIFENVKIPISEESIAGYVAYTGKMLNIKDVRKIRKNSPYKFNTYWDENYGYTTKSMLVMPMINQKKEVIGVIQLLNANKSGKVVSFTKEDEKIISYLSSQSAAEIENRNLNVKIYRANLNTIYRLGIVAEYRNKETTNHIIRMSHYCALIAQKLAWSDKKVNEILLASRLHDIGKLGIPDAILEKPDKHNHKEEEIMKQHCLIGEKILSDTGLDLLEQARIIAYTHHEKYDGTGYPQGLKGENIPIIGRIAKLSDDYDAYSSKRCYKEAYSEEKILSILHDEKGKSFDPKLVDLFLDNINEVNQIKEKYSDDKVEFDKLSNISFLEFSSKVLL